MGLSPCPLRASCVVFPNAWLCVLLVVQSSSGEIHSKVLMGPPGKGSSSWENFKNLRLSEGTRGVDWGYC